jgi:hypothetical protein
MAAGHVTRQWSYTLTEDYPGDLSLSADGSRLTFTQILSGTMETVARTLTASTPSGTVDSASRVLLRPHGSHAGVESAQVSPDGSTLYACTSASPAPLWSTITLAAYSVTTGQQTRLLRTWPPAQDLLCRLTMDPSGRNLLVAVTSTPDGRLVKPTKRPVSGTALKTKLFALDLTSGGFRTLPIQVPVPLEAFAW